MSSAIKYRPELDGIRAIAVISVILFHLREQLLPGGFSGVDVFFVLSGFLITSIMKVEIEGGIFCFRSFYVRRMKRILPPLYLVIFVTFIFSFFVFTSNDIKYLSQSIQSILIFGANFFFQSGGGYFTPQASEVPLLHTWSLSVEEQFYFVWPFLFSFLYRKDKRLSIVIFVFITIVSFGLSEVALRIWNQKMFAYYSLATRGGEMLLGALLAISISKYGEALNQIGRFGKNAQALGGISLLAVSLIFLNEGSTFPGISSLLPTLGTCLLILGVWNVDSVISRVLSSTIFVHFGKLSYSLYLWHWPILAFMRYMNGIKDLTIPWIVVGVFLTYALSLCSYYLLEGPIRKMKLSFYRALIYCFLIPGLVILGCVKLPEKIHFSDKNSKFTNYGGDEVCHGKITNTCVRGDLSKAPRILVVGDSHAAHLNYFFDKLGKDTHLAFMVVSSSSCGPVFNFNIQNLPDWAREGCSELIDYLKKSYTQYDTVVFAARWEFQLGFKNNPQSDPHFDVKLENTLKTILGAQKKVLLVSQVPLLSVDPSRTERAKKLGVPVKITYDRDYYEANKRILEIADKFPSIGWIDIASIVESMENGFYYQGHSVYMDNNHLNQFGAESIGKIFGDKTKIKK